MRLATIYYIDDSTIDVTYDDNDEDEEGLPPQQLLALAGKQDSLNMQLAVFINLARCYFNMNKLAMATNYCTYIITVLRGQEPAPPLLAKAQFVRAKVLCSLGLFQLAYQVHIYTHPYRLLYVCVYVCVCMGVCVCVLFDIGCISSSCSRE